MKETSHFAFVFRDEEGADWLVKMAVQGKSSEGQQAIIAFLKAQNNEDQQMLATQFYDWFNIQDCGHNNKASLALAWLPNPVSIDARELDEHQQKLMEEDPDGFCTTEWEPVRFVTPQGVATYMMAGLIDPAQTDSAYLEGFRKKVAPLQIETCTIWFRKELITYARL